MEERGKMVACRVLDQISQEAGGTRERFQMMVVQMVNQAIWLGRRSGSDDQQLEDLINRVIVNQQGLQGRQRPRC